MIKKKIYVFIIVVICLIGLCACGKDAEKYDSENDNIKLCTVIEDNIKAIKGINDAVVFIKEDTALVAIKSEVKEDEVSEQLRSEIESIITSFDDIGKVSISSDDYIFGALKKMSREPGSGNTFSNFKEDIKEIINNVFSMN